MAETQQRPGTCLPWPPVPRPPVFDRDPVVQLVYELMRRGSVTPQTMGQVVARVADGKVGVYTEGDAARLDEARELCGRLPWYGGA